MSIGFNLLSNLFLAEERSRLGLKAKDVADYAGIAIPTQSNYEQGKRYPDAHYLIKIAELGFDINYVITGRRDSLLLTTQEKLLVELFRQASESVQKHVITGLMYGEQAQVLGTGNTVSVGDDNTGNIAGRDIKLK